jgi:sulfatase modifying factor 1
MSGTSHGQGVFGCRGSLGQVATGRLPVTAPRGVFCGLFGSGLIGCLIVGCRPDDSAVEPSSPASSSTERFATQGPSPSEPLPEGMVWLSGGRFTMGSSAAYAFANESPAHSVEVGGFFIDRHSVTNRQYLEFVEQTGYRTVAERPVEWEELKKQLPPGTAKPAEETLQPGSLVFQATEGPVDLRQMSAWWKWTIGANWRQPEGPGSDLEGRWDHPVVHIAWEDAEAYCRWVGKRLPTEAEWEYAARGGLNAKRFAWGDVERPGGEFRCNRWTGDFPYHNDEEDGFYGTAPVGSFPPNDYGLFDMGGNVWNWCSDIYDPGLYARRANRPEACRNPQGPRPEDSIAWLAGDPSPPTAPGVQRRVIRGGSFLCHPGYCESYRPSARRGSTPDTASSHVGFRCVLDGPN